MCGCASRATASASVRKRARSPGPRLGPAQDHLQRHHPAAGHLPGLVDHPHAAAAQGAEDLVAGDDRQPRRARALGGHQQPGRHPGDRVRQGTGGRGHRFVRPVRAVSSSGVGVPPPPRTRDRRSRGRTTGKGSPPPRRRLSTRERIVGHAASPGPGEPGMDCTPSRRPTGPKEGGTVVRSGTPRAHPRGVRCHPAGVTPAPPFHRRSSSRIVPTPRPSRISAPMAPDRLTKNVSSASFFLSPRTTMVIVLLVSPGAKVSVPDRAS